MTAAWLWARRHHVPVSAVALMIAAVAVGRWPSAEVAPPGAAELVPLWSLYPSSAALLAMPIYLERPTELERHATGRRLAPGLLPFLVGACAAMLSCAAFVGHEELPIIWTWTAIFTAAGVVAALVIGTLAWTVVLLAAMVVAGAISQGGELPRLEPVVAIAVLGLSLTTVAVSQLRQ